MPRLRGLTLIPDETRDTKDENYYLEDEKSCKSQNVLVKLVMRYRKKSDPSGCFVDGSNIVRILLNRQRDLLYWAYEDSYQTSTNWTVNLTSSWVSKKGAFSGREEVPEDSVVTPEKEMERMMKDLSSFVSLRHLGELEVSADLCLFNDEDVPKIKGVIKSQKKYRAKVSKGALSKLPKNEWT